MNKPLYASETELGQAMLALAKREKKNLPFVEQAGLSRKYSPMRQALIDYMKARPNQSFTTRHISLELKCSTDTILRYCHELRIGGFLNVDTSDSGRHRWVWPSDQ